LEVMTRLGREPACREQHSFCLESGGGWERTLVGMSVLISPGLWHCWLSDRKEIWNLQSHLSPEILFQNKHKKKGKREKEEYLYSTIYTVYSLKALRHGSHSFTCKLHHACVHQMAPPVTQVADIQLQFTTHLSTPEGWKAKLAWLVDL